MASKRWKSEKWISTIAILVLMIVAKLVSDILPRLIWIWVELLLFLGVSIYSLFFSAIHKDHSGHTTDKIRNFIILLFALSLLLLYSDSLYYCFIGRSFVFLLPACILGIPLGVGIAILQKKQKKQEKTQFSAIILFCAIAVFSLNPLLMHLNYTLDFEQPEEYAAVIRDKDYTRRRKGKDTYKFELSVDGQTIRQEVSSDDYYSYEEGDTYTVQKYDGAFGITFFLPAP